MHRHLDQYRTKGEWFELNDLVEVRTILSQYLSVSDLMNGEVAHMAENIKLSARFQKAQEIASAQDTPWFMKLLLVIWLMCLPTEIALKRRAPNDGEILERRRNRSPDNPFVIDLDQMDYQFSEDEL